MDYLFLLCEARLAWSTDDSGAAVKSKDFNAIFLPVRPLPPPAAAARATGLEIDPER